MTAKTLLLTALVVTLLATGTINAQVPPPTCFPNTGPPPIVRAEGMAELVSDIMISCTQPGASPIAVQLDLRITLNTTITNNRNFGLGIDVTDALSYIYQVPACPPCGPSSITGPMYGKLLPGNTLQWQPVFTIPPGTSGPQVMLHIGNIRAQAFGVQPPFPGSMPAITASIALGPSSSPVAGFPFNQLFVASAQPGLMVAIVSGMDSFRVRLNEPFPTSFKPLGTPITSPMYMVAQEDGYLVPGLGANGGGATQGTRFMLRFKDIPGGVQLLVPHVIQINTPGTSGAPILDVRRVFGADESGGGGCYYLGCTTPPPSGTASPVEDRKGSGFAVYEVVSSSPYTLDQIDVTVIACKGKVDQYGGCHSIVPPSSLRNLAVRTSLAPVTTTAGWYSSAPVPRFVEVGIQTLVP